MPQYRPLGKQTRQDKVMLQAHNPGGAYSVSRHGGSVDGACEHVKEGGVKPRDSEDQHRVAEAVEPIALANRLGIGPVDQPLARKRADEHQQC